MSLFMENCKQRLPIVSYKTPVTLQVIMTWKGLINQDNLIKKNYILFCLPSFIGQKEYCTIIPYSFSNPVKASRNTAIVVYLV